jgi:hypothetical protein
MRAILVLLAVLVLAPCAADAKTITVRGEGFASCSAWLREHAAQSGRQPVQDSWILGYVNAAASMLEIPGVDDVSAMLRNADLVSWIDMFCGEHPEEPLIRAADQLMRELARRAQDAN